MSKRRTGNFFEDFTLGETLRHAVPRTLHGGDLSLYIAATGDRRPLNSSTPYATSLGFRREVVHELLGFHVVFGKSVSDISLNAVANLGYADLRFLEPVYPGDTLSSTSEIIGLRETSSGKNGVVYVKTRGLNQRDQEVLSFNRWVLVNKRDPSAKTGIDEVPDLPKKIAAADLPVPSQLNLDRVHDLRWATGGDDYWEDYKVGEVVHHSGGMTLEESDHMQLTRLVQNTAKVHFNQHTQASSRFGKRLIYGGHIISVAHALAFDGLENVLCMAGWNGGSHANPTFAGDTIYASSEILATEALPSPHDGLGALRIRMVAYKNADPGQEQIALRGPHGKYDPSVVLDLDYWALIPKSSE
ncbi:MAG: MaoC family dehydratase [Myxococcales bacterium]|nr:MaoC family dehydratase [Myxococcales bacterium]